MTSQLYDTIPSLDLADFTSGTPEQKNTFVHDLGAAYENIGFVAIKNHGLSDELQLQLYDAITSFFELSQAEKDQYDGASLNGQRGYTGKEKEHAKGRSIGDLKEFYHIGQQVSDNDPIAADYPENIWPVEIPQFERSTIEAYKQLEETGKMMMRAIALHLDLNENHFDQSLHNGNSILRAIHYYPIEEKQLASGAVRAAEHGDINLITLLMGASAAGLEVQRRDGKWIPITALPNQIIVNVGDMLERLTNDRLQSTIHRVVNPENEDLSKSRFSIPFFMHPRMEMDLSCLETCVSEQCPLKYAPITAGEFLKQRLEEIGLLKK